MDERTLGMFLAGPVPFLTGIIIAIFATRVKHQSRYAIGSDGEKIQIQFRASSFPTVWRTYGLCLAFYWLLLPLIYAPIATLANLGARAKSKRRGSAIIEIGNGKITSTLLKSGTDSVSIDIQKVHRFVLRNPFSDQESSAGVAAFAAIPVSSGVSGGIAMGMTAAAAGAASIGAGFAQANSKLLASACWHVDAEGGGKSYTLACGMDEETGRSLLNDIHHAVDVYQSAANSPSMADILKSAYQAIGEIGNIDQEKPNSKLLVKVALAASIVITTLYFFSVITDNSPQTVSQRQSSRGLNYDNAVLDPNLKSVVENWTLAETTREVSVYKEPNTQSTVIKQLAAKKTFGCRDTDTAGWKGVQEGGKIIGYIPASSVSIQLRYDYCPSSDCPAPTSCNPQNWRK